MIADGAATTRSAGGMDMHLLEAATSGDTSSMKQLALQDPGVLLGTTHQGNTCLHIASAHGHEAFCNNVLALNQSLVTTVNNDEETALITAVKCGHMSLARELVMFCRRQLLSNEVLQKDKKGSNALHYAIRSGHVELALELIDTVPALSRGVNNNNESPLFISVMKNFIHVSEKLMQVPNFAHAGASGQNVLHAAVRKGNPGTVALFPSSTGLKQLVFFTGAARSQSVWGLPVIAVPLAPMEAPTMHGSSSSSSRGSRLAARSDIHPSMPLIECPNRKVSMLNSSIASHWRKMGRVVEGGGGSWIRGAGGVRGRGRAALGWT